MKWERILGVLFVLGILAMFWGGHLFLLVFGWIAFLGRVGPQMTFDPLAIAYGAAALALFVVGVHFTARWLRGPASHRPWRLRSSVALVFGFVVLFAAGIAIVGGLHQATWLFTRETSVYGHARFPAATRMSSANNLKQIALGLQNYHDTYNVFTPGGTYNAQGEGLYGWAVPILPYLSVMNNSIDFARPWHAEPNRQLYSGPIRDFVNPGIGGELAREDGIPVSHYAGNMHVLPAERAVKLSDITDASQTLLVGEVNANFRAWPSSFNVRDPGLGINRSPDGFGGPGGQPGAQFAMVDGSVRMISAATDPHVLRQLADPQAKKAKLPVED